MRDIATIESQDYDKGARSAYGQRNRIGRLR